MTSVIQCACACLCVVIRLEGKLRLNVVDDFQESLQVCASALCVCMCVNVSSFIRAKSVLGPELTINRMH